MIWGKWGKSCIITWTCIWFGWWTWWTFLIDEHDECTSCKCLVDATVLWYACYPWIYIARWMIEFYAMNECGTYVMFGC